MSTLTTQGVLPLFFCSLTGLRPVTSLDTISDSGFWGLLFHTCYLSIKSLGGPSLICIRTVFLFYSFCIRAYLSVVCTYLIPNKGVLRGGANG